MTQEDANFLPDN